MKKILKMGIIVLIIFVLLGMPVTTLATNISQEKLNEVTNEEIKENEKDEKEENNIENNRIENGKVSIHINLDFETNKKDFIATLTNVSNNSKVYNEDEIVKEDKKIYCNFSNIPNGEYKLKVKSNGYITYERNISINGDKINIELSNKAIINDNINSNNKYGLICIGDINNDGKIDKNDENIMIEKISKGSNDSQFDLNGDGIVNIVDLSYITYNKEKIEQGVIQTLLLMDQSKIEIQNNTKIEVGNLNNIFEDNSKTITLGTNSNEEISAQNPVQVTLNIENTNETEGIVIKPSQNSNNQIEKGEFQLTYIDGSTEVVTINEEQIHLLSTNNTFSKGATAIKEKDGTIVIDLNGQVAIKQISIKVTKSSGNNLVDIGKVEFLNNMESRIPEPTMNIPINIKAIPDDQKFTVTWDKETNITGYEIKVTRKQDGKSQIYSSSINTITINQFNNDKILNYTEYEVQVQSMNEKWRSGYGEKVSVIPVPSKVPDAPENITVKGGYCSLDVSWKNMKSTKTYTIYYKEYNSENEYQKIENIETNHYLIQNLKDNTQYKIYLTGTNEIGTSKPSTIVQGSTTGLEAPITTNYKLLNTPNGTNQKTNHIKNVEYPQKSSTENYEEFDIVDNDYSSYWRANTWDIGGLNSWKNGPIVEFDNTYKINHLILVAADFQIYDYDYMKVRYWDNEGNVHNIDARLTRKQSVNNKKYCDIKLNTPIEAKKIQVNLASSGAYYSKDKGPITISEMKFYYYDSLEDDIYNLYSDQMHTTLRQDVNEKTIKELQIRLDTKDEISQEYHPDKDLLQKELDTAKEILNDKNIKQSVKIDTSVSKAYDSHITFKGGLTAMQPIGVSCYSGETINLYIGNPNKKTGDNTNLNLVVTQYHAEASSWIKTIKNLKVGKNEITIPQIQSLDVENGGALYIEYTGNNQNEIYGVRVSGGIEIPILDVSKIQEENERKEEIKTYIEKLEQLVPKLEEKHKEHQGKDKVGEYIYDERNCILGATDIVMKNTIYSVSSKQILQGLGNGNIEQKTEQLYNSIIAMEKMMDLFYQHKGLSNDKNAGEKNKLPTSRINIRYQRMFAGAFMYAGGLHIGIEYGSIPGLTKANPVKSSEDGLYESGNYFGWGIAHEIGHIINEGSYAIAEITNNYYSVLAQAKDTNDSVRFSYDDVYKKVTSNTTGRDNNVFTQLGMYWQLHLAYDKDGYNFKTYSNYQEQFDNLIFARMDTYARDTSKAPSPNGIELKLNAGTDDNFMRLASAAAQKDLTKFFVNWGMTPNEETTKYISQFAKEEKSIYYINDEARRYQLEKKEAMSNDIEVKASLSNEKNSNKVKIQLSNNSKNQDAILGYEIIRTEYQKGQAIEKTVGFVQNGTEEFIDTIETVNNRTFSYKVIAYDKYLNKTKSKSLQEIKISHDGSINKSDWKITTNMVSNQDKIDDAQEQDPCEPTKVSAITQIIDNYNNTTYIGKNETQNPEIKIELPEKTNIVGIKYTLQNNNLLIKDYEIYVSNDNENWEKVQQGIFDLSQEQQIIYFNKENDPQMYIYNSKFIKIIAKGQENQEIAISELDLIGPTSDNIELLQINGTQNEYSIGILKDSYNKNGVNIPKGSLIFTGNYKGNPAYNAVLLYDENGQIVGGINEDETLTAKQIILADVPEKGELGETSNGTWIYYIEPDENGNITNIPKSVRAELYRVDNALTLEGERLVSNTLNVILPKILPEIEIKD